MSKQPKTLKKIPDVPPRPDDIEHHVLTTLFKKTQGGGVSVYESYVKGDKLIRTTWTDPRPKLDKNGIVIPPKKEPKKQVKELVGETKHTGKKNEQTPFESMKIKANAEWKCNKDSGFSEVKPKMEPLPFGVKTKEAKAGRSQEELDLPMQVLKRDDKPLATHCCVSAKEDGKCGFYRVRDKKIMSRSGEEFVLQTHLHLPLQRFAELAEEELLEMGYEPKDGDSVIVKGVAHELDLPDSMQLSFQEKCKVIRQKENSALHPDNEKIVAKIFDIGDQSIVPFRDRYKAMCAAYDTWYSETVENGGLLCLQLVRCITVDTDERMVQSLIDISEEDPNYTIEKFAGWLVEKYDGHAEKWESFPPLPVQSVYQWINNELEITPNDRVRLLHRWLVESMHKEGIIIRDLDGLYCGNEHRDASVMKQKDFEDEEAVVVDYTCAKGTQEGAVILIMRSLESKATFKPTGFATEMGMTIPVRRALYNEYVKGKPIGTVYTVRFQEKTDKGKPRFPVITNECDPDSKVINGKSLRVLAQEAIKEYKAQPKKPKGAKKAKSKAKDDEEDDE